MTMPWYSPLEISPQSLGFVLALLGLCVGCGSDDSEPEKATIPPPVANECIPEPTAGLHHFQGESLCGGFDYRVNVPARCVKHACGLILDVHGWQMTGDVEEREDEVAERGAPHDFIVVQPTAHIGPAIPPFGESPSWSHERDFPFLSDFVDRAVETFHIDTKRVHVTGFSQGGMMTWRFLCERSDLLASVAPGGASSGYGPLAPGASGICRDGKMPPNEISILYLHGHSDALVSFEGAKLARDAILSGWGMSTTEVVASDPEFTRTKYTNAPGTPFEFLEHDYAASIAFLRGHCFPGSTSKSALACLGPNAFHWGEELVDFFVLHAKP